MTFNKIESQNIPDIHSVGHLYVHEETGAQVLYLENEDKNKSFTIGFKTPPYSDNGITHIIEHSVLNGSKKYPSKEPFVEIIKGSMNTFVNAMTFADKTIYPVASTNDQDFSNLMSVYLDAVFEPNLRQNPQILAQEGWHYHLEKAEDELIYKGVVYNEMKGAMASPDDQMYHAMSQSLYPDSIYQYESGGLPSAITDLTQKEFVDYHQEYYHPSNSLTVLYGDLDINHAFERLEEYFSGKGKTPAVDLKFNIQEPSQKEINKHYSITEGDDPADKDYLCLAWHVSTADRLLEAMAFEILEEILFGNNQSPLKKALLDAEIGGDISGGHDLPGYTEVFMILAKYSSANKMEDFKKVVKETLAKLVDEGIDPAIIQASINKISFRLKERVISESRPRGLFYTLSAYQTWLYDFSPFDILSFSERLTELRKLAKEGYFEKLIEEKLLNNNHRVAITLEASPGLSDQKEAKQDQELQAYKSQLSQQEVEDLVASTQALIERQVSVDKSEDLAKIPMLTKEDLTTETEELPLTINPLEKSQGKFYHADQFTSGIDYLSLYWDIRDLEVEEYSRLSLLAKLMSGLATKNYSSDQLQQQMDTHTGGILASVDIVPKLDGSIQTYFALNGKALEASSDHLIDLMQEIMTSTLIEDQQEILRIIQELIAGFENRINFGAHVLALKRALSQYKPALKLEQMTSGIDFFNYLKECRDLLKEGKGDRLLDQLKTSYQKILNFNRLNILYTGNQERASLVKNKVLKAFNQLPSKDLGPLQTYPSGKKQNEAFVTAQDVNYVGLAADASDHLQYSGASKVLSNELNLGYLWNTIRVQGGAYGSGYGHDRLGSLYMMSYRDPNIRQSVESYLAIPAYVRQLELSESELLKNIIGSLSPLERPKSAHEKGVEAFTLHLTGLDYRMISQLKEEMIAVTNEQLNDLADGLENALQDYTLAVIGNKAKIEKDKDLFDVIYELY
ncbi:insulinase family protein [Facklamia sp. P12945]|uniref:insulinase family protein n=1 Tax=Facklamia sp. P12945 TaxID=3421950 RepID=UPI003D170B5A